MIRSFQRVNVSMLATLAGLLLGATGTDAIAAKGATERWEWSGRVAAGQKLEIFGVNGDIEAEPASGNAIEIVAEKRGRKQDPADVRIEVVEHSGGVTICAVYPGAGNACEAGRHQSHTRNNDVTVDFHVRVPRGVSISAQTVNGDVAAHGLSAPIKATTVNGTCDIETSGSGEATTVNGDVRAVLGHMLDGDRLEFTTVNGSVRLVLPDDTDADVEGSTVNGSIHSDFPMRLKGRWGPRSMRGTLGRGGAQLKLTSVNGSLSLSRAD